MVKRMEIDKYHGKYTHFPSKKNSPFNGNGNMPLSRILAFKENKNKKISRILAFKAIVRDGVKVEEKGFCFASFCFGET